MLMNNVLNVIVFASNVIHHESVDLFHAAKHAQFNFCTADSLLLLAVNCQQRHLLRRVQANIMDCCFGLFADNLNLLIRVSSCL